jgi:YYY domain-containing protein
VLQDYGLDGRAREVIDEFPAFSYLLGDLHPHVLAMPFALLLAALAFNTYLRRSVLPAGLPFLNNWQRQPGFWLAALALGGMAFLNTWDFPIYLALYAAAALLPDLVRRGWRWQLGLDFVSLAAALGLLGGVLYLPFYLTFSSQAGGIMPSLVYFTRGVHFWIMFGSLLAPAVAWLAWEGLRGGRTRQAWPGLLFAAGLIAGLWLLSTLYGFARLVADPSLAGDYGTAEPAALLAAAATDRLAAPGTWLTLLALLALAWACLLRQVCPPGEDLSDANPRAGGRLDRPGLFVLLLFLVGLGLALFPEFFYLRDLFRVRMNTIFKFYFQAWILWSIAAAYGTAVLLAGLRGARLAAFGIGWALLVALTLPYPIYGVLSRTNSFRPEQWSLDGAAFLARYAPDEMAAIVWLRQAPYGVVAEAVGGSYTGFARVSTHSGLPTMLGWPGHESQWRGGMREIGSREPDVERLYRARQWEQASEIIEKYNIRYVFLGSLERSTYRPDEALFRRNLVEVFRSNEVTIYEVPRYNFVQGQAGQP